jgi:hypothetical protein
MQRESIHKYLTPRSLANDTASLNNLGNSAIGILFFLSSKFVLVVIEDDEHPNSD